MRLTIVVLVLVLAVGGSIVAFGFLTNQGQEQIMSIDPYTKLENYKNELEKINKYNQEILDGLRQKIADSDNSELEQLRQEIEVLEGVISDNKAELEKIMHKLSDTESAP